MGVAAALTGTAFSVAHFQEEPFGVQMVALLLATSALSVLGLVVAPWSALAYRLAGGLSVSGLGAKAFMSAGWHAEETYAEWVAFAATCATTLTIGLLWSFWHSAVYPWHAAYRRQRLDSHRVGA